MKKRDNDFVDSIIALADEHFARNEGLPPLMSAVAEKLESAELQASTTSTPFSGDESRWAIRKILFQPNLWPGVEPRRGDMRRAALEQLLELCKDGKDRGRYRPGNRSPF